MFAYVFVSLFFFLLISFSPFSIASETNPAASSPVLGGLYVPPTRGAPGRRVGGATRGFPFDQDVLNPRARGGLNVCGKDGNIVRFSAIAPNDPGLSGAASPDLYWFSSRAISDAITFTIQDHSTRIPLAEFKLTPIQQPGLQRIALAEMGVKLVPGQKYVWSVTIHQSGNNLAKDCVARAMIYYETGPDPAPDMAQAVRELAGTGRWYEAIAFSASALELSHFKTQLLVEVGLGDIARLLR